MQPLTFKPVNQADRWQVYQRLQELDIACECSINQPLKVDIHSPTAAIQLQSVIKQFTAERSALVEWLERCWHSEI